MLYGLLARVEQPEFEPMDCMLQSADGCLACVLKYLNSSCLNINNRKTKIVKWLVLSTRVRSSETILSELLLFIGWDLLLSSLLTLVALLTVFQRLLQLNAQPDAWIPTAIVCCRY